MSVTAFIGLGSNLGDRHQYIDKAIKAMQATAGVTVVGVSTLINTPAWGLQEQPDFLNGVVKLQTTLTASQLLAALQQIELNLGRVRNQKWGPRVIDLDILFYGDEAINLPHLVVPHPYLHQRLFALSPLKQLCPQLVHPVLGKTISQLWQEVTDETSLQDNK